MKEKVGVKFTCPKCGHKQTYKGKSKYYAGCSMCKKSVKIGGSEK
jgi:transcription elongation factor Elf1